MARRVVIWSAVSSLPQAKKVSLDDQLSAGRDHSQRHGATVVAELIVPGESRDIVLFEDACKRIEAYKRLSELIAARAFDVLMYYDTSRLGRTASLSMTVSELCSRANILLYEIGSPPPTLTIDPAEHNNLLMAAFKGVESQREIEKLKDRNRRGMLGKVESGHFGYRINWGYSATYDGRGRVTGYTIDEDVAFTLRKFVELYLGGMGLAEIGDELNRLGRPSPTPGGWNKGRVANIIDHIWRYAGYAEINSRSTTGRPYLRAKGVWPAILTEETARAILAEREQRWGASKMLVGTHRYSLVLFCAECGKRLSATNTYGKNSHTLRERFMCRQHGTISARKVHQAMIDFISHLEQKTFRESLIVADSPAVTENIMTQIEAHRIQIEKLSSGIASADADHYLGNLPRDRHRTIVDAAQRRIESVTTEITKLEDRLHQQQQLSQRADRVEEIRRIGMERLTDDDVKAANAWIRHHFRLWVRDSEIVAVDIL